MKILELDKNFCRKYYNGNYKKMIEKLDGLIFDERTTRRAFSFGNGTEKDLMRYIKDNRQYCKYYDLENNAYI